MEIIYEPMTEYHVEATKLLRSLQDQFNFEKYVMQRPMAELVGLERQITEMVRICATYESLRDFKIIADPKEINPKMLESLEFNSGRSWDAPNP